MLDPGSMPVKSTYWYEARQAPLPRPGLQCISQALHMRRMQRYVFCSQPFREPGQMYEQIQQALQAIPKVSRNSPPCSGRFLITYRSLHLAMCGVMWGSDACSLYAVSRGSQRITATLPYSDKQCADAIKVMAASTDHAACRIACIHTAFNRACLLVVDILSINLCTQKCLTVSLKSQEEDFIVTRV